MALGEEEELENEVNKVEEKLVGTDVEKQKAQARVVDEMVRGSTNEYDNFNETLEGELQITFNESWKKRCEESNRKRSRH